MTTSVAICTYNGASFVEEQIASILDQTILVGEIVVCDDGSSDNTVEIIRHLSSRTQIPIRIYINETNLGCVKNFEKAISLCKGDVIFLSDQDDKWEKQKVETIINWFEKHPDKEVVISDAVLIDENGNQLVDETYFSLYFNEESRMLFDNGYGLELFVNRNRACGATMAIRPTVGYYLSEIVNNENYRIILQKCLEYGIIHDYLIAIKAIGDGKLGYINKVLTQYRQHRNQVCGVGVIEKINGDQAYLLDYDKGSRLIGLPLIDAAKTRIDFIYWRSLLRKDILAPFKVLCQMKQYKVLYGIQSIKFMKYDIEQFLQKSLNRIVNLFLRMPIFRVEKVFISYGDENFKRSLKRLKREAEELNIFDKIVMYTPKDLPKAITDSPLMRYKRGGGYWLWKPYIIWKTMERYPNAIVVYADAGCAINKNYEEWYYWFKLMKDTDTLLTHYQNDIDYGWIEPFGTSSVKISTWTKRITMDYFDKRFKCIDWHDKNKIWGGFMIVKNNSSFVQDVLNTMLKFPELVRDPEGDEIDQQYAGFCAHRHDQSIITPLAYWYEKKYPQIVKIIPETAESISTSAVVTKRIKDKDIPSLTSKIVMTIKSLIGEKWYNRLHFWNR